MPKLMTEEGTSFNFIHNQEKDRYKAVFFI